MKARWVFWDLGDTLLNEDPLRYHIYELLFDALRSAGRGLDFSDLLVWREELVKREDTKPHYTIAERELPEEVRAKWADAVRRHATGEWMHLVQPVSGAVDVLRQFAGRYRMGIIADQPEGTVEALVRLGIREHFNVVALDVLVGHRKPDEQLFRWALQEAGCSPDETIMVGNRLDTDIAPARRLGMRTILCTFSPTEKGWEPETENARLYRESITRTPNWSTTPNPANPDETPDATVGMMSCIPAVLNRWDAAEP